MSGKNAAEIAQLREWMNWYADRLQEEATKHTRTKEELKEVRRKFDNFLDSAGKTMYPCPECERGMNSREGCLHCKIRKLEEENSALKVGIEHWKNLYEDAKGRSLSWK